MDKNSNILMRSFKTELILDESNSLVLDGQSRICNWLYNHLLELSINDYKESGNTLNLASGYNARNYMVNELKPKYKFLGSLFSRVSNATAMRINTSYKKFFKEKKGFPKFKSWKKQWFSLVYDDIENGGIKLIDKELTLSLGKNEEGKRLYVKGKLKQTLKYKGEFKLKTLTITKKQNKFFVSISIELEKKKEITTDKSKWIVIDPNHKNFFVGLNYKGEAIEFKNANCFKYFDKEIDYVKSMLDLCKKEKTEKIDDKYVKIKGSKKYYRYLKVLNDLYNKRQEQIKHVLYRLANWLNKEYDFIGIGDYVPSTETAIYDNMHRSMLNQSYIGYFRRILKEVCEKSYKIYKELDERNTTKRCNFCGDMEKHLPDERIFTCKKCGKTIYRDLNSCFNFAINEEFLLSGTDFVGMDFTKPTYTFNLSHKIDSFYNLVVTERIIKEKSW